MSTYLDRIAEIGICHALVLNDSFDRMVALRKFHNEDTELDQDCLNFVVGYIGASYILDLDNRKIVSQIFENIFPEKNKKFITGYLYDNYDDLKKEAESDKLYSNLLDCFLNLESEHVEGFCAATLLILKECRNNDEDFYPPGDILYKAITKIISYPGKYLTRVIAQYDEIFYNYKNDIERNLFGFYSDKIEITEEIAELATLSGNYKFIPDKMKTERLSLIAVKKDGYALEYVPEELKTDALCRAAVKESNSALEYVPEKLRTEELCKLAVRSSGGALRYVPEKLKTESLCIVAVKESGCALKYVPEELKSVELCTLAVKKSGYALEYVPEELKTEDLCRVGVAAKYTGDSLQHVPERLRTEELCNLAVKSSGYALKYVPEKLKTKDICLDAIRSQSDALQYVPEKLKTEEFWKLAININGYALKYAPEKLKTLEICLNAVKKSRYAREYVPKALLSKIPN